MVHTWNSTVKVASLEHLRLCFRVRLKTDRKIDTYISRYIYSDSGGRVTDLRISRFWGQLGWQCKKKKIFSCQHHISCLLWGPEWEECSSEILSQNYGSAAKYTTNWQAPLAHCSSETSLSPFRYVLCWRWFYGSQISSATSFVHLICLLNFERNRITEAWLIKVWDCPSSHRSSVFPSING